jgi:hypothetical protein
MPDYPRNRLLIVIALGVVGLLVRKPLEMALRPVLQFHKASAASANSLGKAPL